MGLASTSGNELGYRLGHTRHIEELVSDRQANPRDIPTCPQQPDVPEQGQAMTDI